MDYLDKVKAHEAEIIMETMECDREQAEWYQENRHELYGDSFYDRAMSKDKGYLGYADTDKLIEADIIYKGASGYLDMEYRALDYLEVPERMELPVCNGIDRFRIRDQDLIKEMEENGVYKLIVQVTANKALGMAVKGLGAPSDPTRYLVEVDKETSILYLYKSDDDNTNKYSLVCAKSMVPEFKKNMAARKSVLLDYEYRLNMIPNVPQLQAMNNSVDF